MSVLVHRAGGLLPMALQGVGRGGRPAQRCGRTKWPGMVRGAGLQPRPVLFQNRRPAVLLVPSVAPV